MDAGQSGDIAAVNDEVMRFLMREDVVIQPNDRTRLHNAHQAITDGRVYDGTTLKVVGEDAHLALACHPFILKHDWISLLGAGFDPWDVGNDFRIPYPMTAFEFLVDGRAIILPCWQAEGEAISMTACVKWGDDWIFAPLAKDTPCDVPVVQMCWDQVRAACVAMDLGVAVFNEAPAPARLNAKRERHGQPPIPATRIVDIAKKHKQTSPGTAPTGTRKRLHFRRGHWRHYEDSKTWIKWMLVGDPELGFVEHVYKL